MPAGERARPDLLHVGGSQEGRGRLCPPKERLVPSWLAVRVAEERAAVFTYISSDLE